MSYFAYGDQIGRVIRTHSAVLEIWRDEFTGLRARPEAYFHLTLHVQLISHPARLAMIERLIDFNQDNDRIRFLRCRDVAATLAWTTRHRMPNAVREAADHSSARARRCSTGMSSK